MGGAGGRRGWVGQQVQKHDKGYISGVALLGCLALTAARLRMGLKAIQSLNQLPLAILLRCCD